MRVSLSGLSISKPFDSGNFLKLTHIRKKNTYAIQVKANIGPLARISRFFSNIFGTQYRNISRVLNSSNGQARLKQVGNKAVRAHLAEINKKIVRLNNQIFVRHIPLIKIPEFTRTSSKPPSRLRASTPRTSSSPRGNSRPPLAKPNTLLVSFYTGSGVNSDMRSLNDIWKFSLNQKESIHNYIQWLFPLTSTSIFNLKAPILNPFLIDELKTDLNFLPNLQKSLDVMLEFYGLEWNETHTNIIQSSNFEERSKIWLKIGNHNHKRLTRILECLQTFELEKENKALFTALKEIKTQHPKSISDKAFNYWEQASLSNN